VLSWFSRSSITALSSEVALSVFSVLIVDALFEFVIDAVAFGGGEVRGVFVEDIVTKMDLWYFPDSGRMGGVVP